eukprot:TRINITY_DN65353_c0_g1_i1.p1 TRINITY_DN65353_c0_g1~~TRINITY_DN65353_c0_g1_i1.p1  ORF type:complete len:227 (+),score=25.74 TRINITY_DN65353_c0_g1_i1:43-681(+)
MSSALPQGACTWFDNYKFQKIVGEGSAGNVYLALDVAGQATKGRASKEVVVKIYKNDAAVHKFTKEVEFMQRVNGHPNVVNLLTSHSVVTKGIIMPFYGEVDLHSYVWQCNGLPDSKAASITRDLLAALRHVHACGIIHRDVKPENMILDQDARAVLLDFDVACDASDLLARSVPCGSPGYVAPEAIEGKPGGFSSDIFSVENGSAVGRGRE